MAISHIDWHLELYVGVNHYSSYQITNINHISSGLAVVFAEDIPNTVEENPVSGKFSLGIRERSWLNVYCHFCSADAWKNLCPRYNSLSSNQL